MIYVVGAVLVVLAVVAYVAFVGGGMNHRRRDLFGPDDRERR